MAGCARARRAVHVLVFGPAFRFAGAQFREKVLLAPFFLAISPRRPSCLRMACGCPGLSAEAGVPLATASFRSAAADIVR